MGASWARVAPWLERAGLPSAITELAARADRSCDALAVAGRATIALLDTVTIFLVYLLGLRLYGRGAGLLAAAFYAFAAQAIQLSHFFAMDPASTTFTVLAVLGSVMMAQSYRWNGVWLAGIGAGLAIASKFSALPILAAPVTAGAIAVLGLPLGLEGMGSRKLQIGLQTTAALMIAALIFFVASPYAVLDWKNFIQATLVEQGQMVRGIADMPFTRQYRNTTPYLYFIRQQVQWGLGWPLGLVALCGTLAMAGLLVRTGARLLRAYITRRGTVNLSRAEVGTGVVWSWVVPYFGLTGAFLAKFNRYMSPVLPFVLLFAAGLVWVLWRMGRNYSGSESDGSGAGTRRRWARWLGGAFAFIGLVGGLGWSLAYVNGVYGREHTWITASRWIYENAPDGSTLLWELWDDPLPKSIPGEPAMDMGSHNLRNIDWSPYEEDTGEKYSILKEKLREADFVVYSSKRIYDSVDELPERYPMTNRYYAAMWDGQLGFELAAQFSSPPRLLGLVFDDREADESWSLYDHPQVSIFRKVRDLDDVEFDAIFGQSWTYAVHYYRGQDSLLNPLLEIMGMGSSPGSADRGLVSALVTWLAGTDDTVSLSAARTRSLSLGLPLAELPVVDNYRWNGWASRNPLGAAATWWATVVLMGWLAWPIGLRIFRPLRDRGYLLSRTLGWLVAAWFLWIWASSGVTANTVQGAWLSVGALGIAGAIFAWWDRSEIVAFVKQQWRMLVAVEALFAVAYTLFLLIRASNPDLWQPWHGGEKFMEFAFLNGILRSPTFPPVDPHFAGGYINYYYYGLYLVAFLTKLTGVYAEVAFNLTIALLFALTIGNAFSIAYSVTGSRSGKWRDGYVAALAAPVFVAILGNLEGFGQIIRQLAARGDSGLRGALPGVGMLADAVAGTRQVVQGAVALPAYDFWGPSRVIPNTINEFPYWSFLFADLHPHLIAMPLAVLFVACLFVLLLGYDGVWPLRRSAGVTAILTFLLGTLASVNLWELPTYAGLGLLVMMAAEYRTVGKVRAGRVFVFAVVYLAGAFALYLPFFTNYVNVGASGLGWVRQGDDLGSWLLVWGALGFLVASWLGFCIMRPTSTPVRQRDPVDAGVVEQNGVSWRNVPGEHEHSTRMLMLSQTGKTPPGQGGVARLWRLLLRRYDKLPRVLWLHRLLVTRSTVGYLVWAAAPLLLVLIGVAAWLSGRAVLGICLLALAPGVPLLWQRREQSPGGEHLASILGMSGFVLLASTQTVYLKDFLHGGDWYRMNTLFKFFIQTWVLWGLAAGIGFAGLWHATGRRSHTTAQNYQIRPWLGSLWRAAAILLIAMSSAYLLLGTPARLGQRMVGWHPPWGTLDGMAFMEQGSFTWPDSSQTFEMKFDLDAIDWLLANVRGNVVIVESAEVDYYRAAGTRVASMTGLSGLRGMHESEQRYGDQVAERERLHREFWDTPSPERTMEIIDQLRVSLVYVGQLERSQHPEGVEKLLRMAQDGKLVEIYSNEKVVIYAVDDRLAAADGGFLIPNPPGG